LRITFAGGDQSLIHRSQITMQQRLKRSCPGLIDAVSGQKGAVDFWQITIRMRAEVDVAVDDASLLFSGRRGSQGMAASAAVCPRKWRRFMP
jgi:hypothetical protein